MRLKTWTNYRFSVIESLFPLFEGSCKKSLFPRLTVPEIGDRIIAATALSLGLPLVTNDHKIRELSVIQTIWDNPNLNEKNYL